MTVEELLNEVRALPGEEVASLTAQILDDVFDCRADEFSEAEIADLRAISGRMKSDPGYSVSFEEGMRQIDQIFNS